MPKATVAALAAMASCVTSIFFIMPWFLHFCDLTLSVVPHESAKGPSSVPKRRETAGDLTEKIHVFSKLSQAWDTLLLAVGTLFMNQQCIPHKMPLNGGKGFTSTESESHHLPWMPRPAPHPSCKLDESARLHRGTWTEAESQVCWLERKC